MIENLDSLVNLEQLWLGKNKITKLQVRFSDTCKALFTQKDNPQDHLSFLLTANVFFFHLIEPLKLEETEDLEHPVEPFDCD